MITDQQIQRWFDRAKAKGATHVVVVHDNFDGTHFPVSVLSEQKVADVISKFSDNLHRVVEVYNTSLSFYGQQDPRGLAWSVS